MVGEGIGHKGVGFRSVLPVCKWPEIYSADPDGRPGNLDGYSFRFARYADLLALSGGNEDLAWKVDREFPPFQIPVPAESIPAAVHSLAEMGHVTVVRLPLDGPSGQTSALALLGDLAANDVPVLLFLERIASLTLRFRKDGETHEEALTRDERPLRGAIAPSRDLRIGLIDLGKLGEFVLASMPVASDRLRLAVSSAIDAHLLSDDWTGWEDAVVSVAVPADFDTVGRIFTFLPMGEEARSPFAGHLNAPFFTKLDRTALDPAHPLNDLLLTVAGEAVVLAASTLQRTSIPAARRWVSDLVCWNGPYQARLADAAQRLFKSRLSDLRLVPVVVTAGHEDGWACLAETFRWPTVQLSFLTPARAAATGACLLDPAIGTGRSAAWERLSGWLGCPLKPGADQLAGLVEAALGRLDKPAPYHDHDDPVPRRRRARGKGRKPARKARSIPSAAEKLRVGQWAAAYADLAVLFDAHEGVLNRREILIDDAGVLRPANVQTPPKERRSRAKRISAFLPPARDEAPVSIPAALRHHLFYLHPAVAEQLTTPVRGFLTGKGLVYGYETRGLLEHVQRVLAGTESERIHRDTLRFVFTLDQNGQLPRRPAPDQLGLRVPTRGGTMLPAQRAAFGPGWPDRHGIDLATIIDEAGDADQELAALKDRLVDPSTDLVRRGETAAQWAAFLARVGVVDGLPCFTPSAANPKIYGRQLADDGERSLGIIHHVVTNLDDRHRLRLIVIYTGVSDLAAITEQVAATPEEPLIRHKNGIVAGPVHITVLAKPDTPVDDDLRSAVVGFEELPDRVIEEFTSAVRGLLSDVVLSSFAALRRNTHRVLNRFSQDLDAAYLGHRMLLRHPEDAEEMVSSLVAQEISAILDNAQVGEFADAKAVESLIKESVLSAREIDPVKEFANRRNMTVEDYVFGLVKNGVYSEMSGLTQSQGDRAHKWTSKIYAVDDASAEAIDLRFAALAKIKSRYENPVPKLRLGVFVRDSATDEFMLCMQPLCDSVRLVGGTWFPFLPLRPVEEGFDFVLECPDAVHKLRLDLRIRDLRMVMFPPINNPPGVVKAVQHDTAFKWLFKPSDPDGAPLWWVGELREGWSHKYANKFADSVSRIGMEDSEWARRYGSEH